MTKAINCTMRMQSTTFKADECYCIACDTNGLTTVHPHKFPAGAKFNFLQRGNDRQPDG